MASKKSPILKVGVLGGGLSGLLAAYLCERNGFEVEIFERKQSVGGNIRTIHEDDWIVECGPNTLLINDPIIEDILADLGLQNELIEMNPLARNRFVYRDGQLCLLPHDLLSFFSSPLLSIASKAAVVKNLFKVRPFKMSAQATVFDFFQQQFGSEVATQFADLMCLGIYANSSDQLIFESAFPRFSAIQKKGPSFLRNLILKGQKRRGRKFKTRSVSFQNGFEALISALEKKLHHKIICNCNIQSIRKEGTSWTISFLKTNQGETTNMGYQDKTFDALVVAQPIDAFVAVTNIFSQQVQKQITQLEAQSVASVSFGFSKKIDFSGFGILVPFQSRIRRLIGVLHPPSFFKGRAPQDRDLLTLILKDEQNITKFSDHNLLEELKSDLNLVFPSLPEIKQTWVFRYPRGIPQPTFRTQQILKSFWLETEKEPTLFFSHPSVGGPGLSDCFMRADKILRDLKKL